MANKKISQLTAVTTPIDPTTDSIPFVQGGVTKKVSAQDLMNIYVSEGTIVTADVLTIGATPVVIAPAPGAGYYLREIRTDIGLDYNSIAYGGNKVLCVKTSTATVETSRINHILESTVDVVATSIPQALAGPPTDTQLIENKAITLTTTTGANPTLGNSDLKYRIYYSIEAIM